MIWLAVAMSLLPSAALAEEGARAASRLGAGSSQAVEAVAALAAVLGLILALGWAVRRFGRLPGGAKGAVRVLGGVALGARERAVLVAVGPTRLLLGVAPGQVRTLHVLPDEPEAASDFRNALAAAKGEPGR
jgi:flagellar protein FliO/FliZ